SISHRRRVTLLSPGRRQMHSRCAQETAARARRLQRRARAGDPAGRLRSRDLRGRRAFRRAAHPRPAGGAVCATPPTPGRTGGREIVTIPRQRGEEGLQARIRDAGVSDTRVMRTIAIYNMKGGVGKTTTAVNLSYLAAESRLRVLLWDLDPQAASTFAFRIRPHVSGFGKRSLENGEALYAAIKETDYENLYLLPADFAYHKLDRLLGSLGNPGRVLTSLLGMIGDDFDVVFLDCPAGFSRLAEAVLAAADAIVAPAIPTVLSLRMVAQLVRQAECSRSRASLAAVFNMVDRRKTLHRQACELAAGHPEIFLRAEIPYASVVEQMAARRAPTAVYAAHTTAATAFAEIWGELQTRLCRENDDREGRRWAAVLGGIELLTERLEWTERRLTMPGNDSAA